MRIFAIIFLTLFIVLLQRVKVHIEFQQKNLDGLLKGKIAFYHFERKLAIIARKRKYMIKKKQKHFVQELWKNANKVVKIQKLSIRLKIGLWDMTLTGGSIPVIAALLEILKYQRIAQYDYQIEPDYGKHFSLEGSLDLKFQIRIFDILLLFLTSIKKRSKL